MNTSAFGMQRGLRGSAIALGIALFAVSPVWAPVARASKARYEGAPVFSFDIFIEPLPRIGQPCTIVMRFDDWSNLPDSLDFDARIELPTGWVLLTGEPRLRGRTTGGNIVRWTIRALPSHGGYFELRASVHIDRGSFGVDEADYIQTVELTRDTALLPQTRPIRLESIRNGQRYRYGGQYLVPIDASETFTESDLEQRAQVISRSDARCGACPADHPEALRWLVIVDAGGRIRSARLLDFGIDPNSAAATSARIALDSWKFSPGRMKAQSVPDWLMVVVPLSK
jgi:hypothetical protein